VSLQDRIQFSREIAQGEGGSGPEAQELGDQGWFLDQCHCDAPGFDVSISVRQAEDGGIDFICGGIADGADGDERDIAFAGQSEDGVGFHVHDRRAGGAKELGLFAWSADDGF